MFFSILGKFSPISAITCIWGRKIFGVLRLFGFILDIFVFPTHDTFGNITSHPTHKTRDVFFIKNAGTRLLNRRRRKAIFSATYVYEPSVINENPAQSLFNTHKRIKVSYSATLLVQSFAGRNFRDFAIFFVFGKNR